MSEYAHLRLIYITAGVIVIMGTLCYPGQIAFVVINVLVLITALGAEWIGRLKNEVQRNNGAN